MNKAALYCRLSKEDIDKIKEGDESESIINQRLLLTNYALEQGYAINNVYIDDDLSGLYNDRPDFERLIEDAKLQKFNIVIAKTQARFTRNMEHVEKYLHNDFPLLGIRFIGVVDGADTSVKSNKKARQINGLVNEWYCEDLSDNIKAVFKEKMKKGQFLGSFACYGYKRDPSDRHKIVIDEDAAKVVKQIFDLSANGYGVDTIAQKLTDMNIPTPTIYKQQNGLNYKNPNDNTYSKNGIWSTTTIKRILNNESYVGTLIQGREKKVSYKSKKVVLAPKSEWIIIENNHEPIITPEMFNKTQELLQHRRKTCKTTSGKYFMPHLFSGRIKCMDCNSTMAKTSGRLAGGYDYFICQLSRKSKQSKCTRHSIRYDELKLLIEQRIKDMLIKYTSKEEEYIRRRIQKEDVTKKINALKAKMNKCSSKIDEISKSITTAYIDKVKGYLTEDDFRRINTSLRDEMVKLENEAKVLSHMLEEIEIKEKAINTFDNSISKYINFTELTYEIVNSLIDCIYIGEKLDGQQKIDVVWKI